MQNSKKTHFREEANVHIVFKSNHPVVASKLLRVHSILGGVPKIFILLFSAALFVISSCSPLRKQLYFKDLNRDTTLRNVVSENFDLKIMKNDVLGINVVSLSPDVAFYNGSSAASGAAAPSGYSLDSNGNIKFVKLGFIHALGLTRKQLKDTLELALVPYLRDAIVTVSFLNRHVTMLGAVSPQVLSFSDDNMTILDALAKSGDIGEKGRMDNVLVIRDENKSKVFKRLNLQKVSIFYSPYYYLQPNDIVYVEPPKNKTPLTLLQVFSYVTTGLSLIFLLVSVFKL